MRLFIEIICRTRNNESTRLYSNNIFETLLGTTRIFFYIEDVYIFALFQFVIPTNFLKRIIPRKYDSSWENWRNYSFERQAAHPKVRICMLWFNTKIWLVFFLFIFFSIFWLLTIIKNYCVGISPFQRSK